ncbi:MAG: (Fe-S)-binding protein [Desulfovibrio sp.]|jgi:Fe-S oxidoreductase|nr:(Fe-S)-binding protein [Desulfovibrio sp.]
MKLIEYYESALERLKNDCIQCGKCVFGCKAMQALPEAPDPRRTQADILDFLRGGASLSASALLKTRACMRCYGCLDLPCPIKVSSLQINELIARELHRRGDLPWDGPTYPVHKEKVEKLCSAAERQRITRPVANPDASTLFFPGCNVYKQPDKLLNALEVLDAIGEPHSFAPGMKYCCGSSPRGMAGDVEWVQGAAGKLFAYAESLNTKTLVFWCPTCLSMLQDRIRHFYNPPFECLSFGQYVLAHLDRLKFPAAVPQRVAYHEPCKNAYMGIDPDSVRQILRAIPGTQLLEMEHHGKDTLCYGCTAVDSHPETGEKATLRRLLEAKACGADTLITMCHNCNWIFTPALKARGKAHGLTFSIENLSTYLTKAMGIARPDSLL